MPRDQSSHPNEPRPRTRHDTAPDARAVRRALRPRLTWPWPDLEDAIAVARHWAEAGGDLGGPLRRLTWPVVRRTNVGFVSALVRHGVAVPPEAVEAAREALRALVNGHAADDAWQRYARWFTELTPDLAVTVLQRLARAGSRPEDERYRAWAFVDAHFPEDSPEVALDLAADTGVHRATRFAIGKTLAARDPAVLVDVFHRVGRQTTAGGIRNQAAEILAPHDHVKSLELFTHTAAGGTSGDADRLTACREVCRRDPDKGVDLLFDFLEDTSTDRVRGEVLDDLHRMAPTRLRTRLDALRRTGAPSTRLHFTRHLVERFGAGPDVVVDLATDPTVPPQMRFASLDIDRRAATPAVVAGIITGFREHGPVKVRAIALLVTLSPEDGFGHLLDLVADRQVPHRARMAAVTEAGRPLDRRRRTELYRSLATEDEATADQRQAALSAVAKIDPSRHRDLCAELARRSDLTVEDRVRFAVRAGRGRALELLREFARDSGEVDAMRIGAARRAASEGAADDRAYLRTLAAWPTVSYRARESLIAELPPADRAAVLRTVADSRAEAVEARLAAAVALGSLDPGGAVTRLDVLAEDRSLPGAVRNRARDAARRLR
ncbi:hypothetical protein AB0425_39185 [Actinosynnema sp. NPDC051121]